MATKTCPHCGGTGQTINFKNCAQRRAARELTLKEVAGKMGISIQYLADLEKGKRNWDAELLERFNKATA